MRMAVEKPDLPVFSCKFQGIFNATVFSELAHHTKTKMIIFTIGQLQGFRLFQVNRPKSFLKIFTLALSADMPKFND